MPFCSRILKAQRLQKFYRDGDGLIFGIGKGEEVRAERITQVYEKVAVKTGKFPFLRFPLLEEEISRKEIDSFLEKAGIREPEMYRLGFSHNNCYGGCVRAGKRQWQMLYRKLPDVFSERARVEREISTFFGKKMTFLKGLSLADIRAEEERKNKAGIQEEFLFENAEECIGICNSFA